MLFVQKGLTFDQELGRLIDPYYVHPLFTEVAARTQFVCERFVGFSVRQLLRTIFNYLILCQGLGLRFWVMLTVSITHTCQLLRISRKLYGFFVIGRA